MRTTDHVTRIANSGRARLFAFQGLNPSAILGGSRSSLLSASICLFASQIETDSTNARDQSAVGTRKFLCYSMWT
jgi:hypothetical protein